MKTIRNFFWFCSGANQTILQKSPTESNKYAGIGGTVLFTGILAAFSAGYALYTVFDNYWSAILFATIWGCMIFNLDRFIVSSMKKRNKFWPEFKIAIPRIVLAILLAMVISKPLELKIFEKEINRKIDVKKSEEIILAKKSINKGFPEITELENKISALKKENSAKEIFRNQKQMEYDFERFGTKTAGTTGIPGVGTNANKKEIQLNEAEKDLKQTTEHNLAKIDHYERDILALYDSRDKAYLAQKPSIDKYDGMAARLDALSTLTKESSAMNFADLFLMLLFIAIETAPIFVKLISEKGPYDDLLEKHEHAVSIYKNEKMTLLSLKSQDVIQTATEISKNEMAIKTAVLANLKQETIDARTEIGRIKNQAINEIELLKLRSKEKYTMA